MPFEIPDNLHPDCRPLAWLLGTWQGNGHGDYPTIEPFQFGQELIFTHDGRPFFHYLSRAWIIDDNGVKVRDAAIESGFIRARPKRHVEVVLSHAAGFSEVWYGHIEDARFEIVTDVVARTESAKEVTAGKRLYGYVEGDLLYAYDMAAMGQPLQPHLWARLQRVQV